MVCIIDYRAGNLKSVQRALDKIGVENVISSDREEILSAERVIFPGVGAAGSAMEGLKELGIGDVLKEAIDSGKPVLGICLGTQIILEHTEEDGGVDTLGLLPGKVIKFQFPEGEVQPVPQMGWNQVNRIKEHPVFKDIEDGANFYFVHSYYTIPSEESDCLTKTDHGSIDFVCAIGRGNLVATQFHPEKSGRHGLKLLENFCSWDGVYA